MIKFTPKQIAWFIPVAYLFHLADEYFTGFHKWFSEAFNVDLSFNDFIIINSIGFSIIAILVTLYTLGKTNHFVIAVLGNLFFVNGVAHIIASVTTMTYSPGTFSAIFIYLPLGFLGYKMISPLLSPFQRNISVADGLFGQIAIAFITMTI